MSLLGPKRTGKVPGSFSVRLYADIFSLLLTQSRSSTLWFNMSTGLKSLWIFLGFWEWLTQSLSVLNPISYESKSCWPRVSHVYHCQQSCFLGDKFTDKNTSVCSYSLTKAVDMGRLFYKRMKATRQWLATLVLYLSIVSPWCCWCRYWSNCIIFQCTLTLI